MDTIYLPGIEIGLMAVMLNGVAMIAQQKVLIWSVALTAAVLLTLKAVASAPVMRWPALQSGLIGGLIAICIASFLTNPSMQSSINVQSNTSGVVTRVDNVPTVVALPYALPSAILYDAQNLVRTAISNVNPSYDLLSVDANGLVNPLKSLLNLRGLAYKTGALESEISEIVSACLSAESGYMSADYAKIGRLVMNAGNSGAGASESIAIPGLTTLPTNIGALLYQASLNTTDKVPGYVLSSDPTSLLSCSDAASAVANGIATNLSSPDFQKWITGSVNVSDTLNPGGAPTYSDLVGKYGASRKMVVSNFTAGAASTANADVLNMAFYELVDSQLNCLKTSGEAKTSCLASVNQSIEMERKNLLDAANMAMSQSYMGQFGPQVLSLLVILSPFLFLFAMFSGTNAGAKLLRIVGYVLIPLVMPAIAAEAVNAIVLYKFSGFINQLTAGGYLSHSLVHEAYKELSISIGTASSLMASMPVVIMGLVGMGEVAARAYDKATTASNASTVSSTTPSLTNNSPVLATRSAGDIHPNLQGGATLIGRGASDPATHGTLMSLSQAVTQNHSKAQAREASVSSAQNWVKDTTQLFHKGTSSQTGVGTDLHRSIRTALEAAEGSSESTRDSDGSQTRKSTQRDTQLSAGVDGSVKAQIPKLPGAKKEGNSSATSSGSPISASFGLSLQGVTKSGASDSAEATKGTSRDRTADQSNRLTTAMSSDMVKKAYQNSSAEERKAFDTLFKKAESVTKTLSQRDTDTDSTGTSAELRRQVAQESAKADADVVNNAIKTNADFRLATLEAEMIASQNPVLSQAIREEHRSMATGERTGATISDGAARSALATLRGLGRIAANETPSEERDLAQKQLLNMFAGLNHQRLTNFNAPKPDAVGSSIPSAADRAEQIETEVQNQLPKPKAASGNPATSVRPSAGASTRVLPPVRAQTGPAPKTAAEVRMPTLDNLPPDLQAAKDKLEAGANLRQNQKAELNSKFDASMVNAQEAGLSAKPGAEAKGTVRRAVGNAWAAVKDDNTPIDLHNTRQTPGKK